MYQIQILEVNPLDGRYEEINFGKTNDLLWVLFTNTTTGTEWVGKFDFGDRYLSRIFNLGEATAIILSKGKVYIVNIIKREIEYTFEFDDWEELMIDNELSLIILTDGIKLYIHNEKGELIHSTKRFSLDGYIFNVIENGILFGKLNNMTDEWSDFEYNLITNELESTWSFDQS